MKNIPFTAATESLRCLGRNLTMYKDLCKKIQTLLKGITDKRKHRFLYERQGSIL